MNELLTEVCDIPYGFPFDSGLFNDSEGIPLIKSCGTEGSGGDTVII
jgi:hypothetical protein